MSMHTRPSDSLNFPLHQAFISIICFRLKSGLSFSTTPQVFLVTQQSYTCDWRISFPFLSFSSSLFRAAFVASSTTIATTVVTGLFYKANSKLFIVWELSRAFASHVLLSLFLLSRRWLGSAYAWNVLLQAHVCVGETLKLFQSLHSPTWFSSKLLCREGKLWAKRGVLIVALMPKWGIAAHWNRGSSGSFCVGWIMNLSGNMTCLVLRFKPLWLWSC